MIEAGGGYRSSSAVSAGDGPFDTVENERRAEKTVTDQNRRPGHSLAFANYHSRRLTLLRSSAMTPALIYFLARALQ